MTTDTRITLSVFVRKHLERAGNDRAREVQCAVNELAGDAALTRTLIAEVIRKAIYQEVAHDLNRQRQAAVGRAVSVARTVASKAVGVARDEISTLLDFPMRSGCALAVATKAEILETAEF